MSLNAFHTMSYINDQLPGLISNAMERISEAAKNRNLEQIQKELAELDENKRRFDTIAQANPASLEITMRRVNNFLEKFGLQDHVFLYDGMVGEDIKKAIELGYEAKMWQLTNGLED